MLALLAAAYGVTSALRARAEETSGRAEPVLATATSRSAWLGSHLTVALAGSALVLVAAGFGRGPGLRHDHLRRSARSHA